jgi:uncharacterized Zn finger protein (UPF0148 family)
MADLTECPACGGPLVGNGTDLRCTECGLTRDELQEFDGIDDVEDLYDSDELDDVEDYDNEDID